MLSSRVDKVIIGFWNWWKAGRSLPYWAINNGNGSRNGRRSPKPVRNTVATGYFFILSPDVALVHPEFLAWSINQAEFQDDLRPYTRGTHMPLVSRSDFQNLTVSLPTIAVQGRIVELQQLIDRERELTTALQLKRGKLVDAISRDLLNGRLKIKDQ